MSQKFYARNTQGCFVQYSTFIVLLQYDFNIYTTLKLTEMENVHLYQKNNNHNQQHRETTTIATYIRYYYFYFIIFFQL